MAEGGGNGMKWRGRKESSNIEDRRGQVVKGAAGLGGLGIILYIALTLLGVDPGAFIDIAGDTQTINPPGQSQEYQENASEQELRQFVSVVFQDIEDVWTEVFERGGMEYQEPTLVLYTQTTQSACGLGQSGMGPFYCPLDGKVYLDLSFYQEMRSRFKAPGDFALAYVLAHEVGHHIQNQLGILGQVQRLRGQVSQKQYNQLSVRLELQADYFAGVWAKYMKGQGYLEIGDVEEAMNAAAAVGDDRIQKEMQGRAIPDSFTHGTSEQRVKWFRKGFTEGTIRGGDTFNTDNL
jgi:predicted metalloprotease